jgi:hypothetical protein
MLEQITQEGMIHWKCVGDEGDCQTMLSAHISTLEYVLPSGFDGPNGATVSLPPCKECDTRCFLKADYSLKELFKLTYTVVDPMGNIKGYALPLSHVRNLLAHHALYQLGKAEHPPILPMPNEGFLEQMAPLGNTDLAYSLWFSWALLKERGQMIASFDQFYLGMVAPVVIPEKGDSHANQIHS